MLELVRIGVLLGTLVGFQLGQFVGETHPAVIVDRQVLICLARGVGLAEALFDGSQLLDAIGQNGGYSAQPFRFCVQLIGALAQFAGGGLPVAVRPTLGELTGLLAS